MLPFKPASHVRTLKLEFRHYRSYTLGMFSFRRRGRGHLGKMAPPQHYAREIESGNVECKRSLTCPSAARLEQAAAELVMQLKSQVAAGGGWRRGHLCTMRSVVSVRCFFSVL